MNLRLAAKGRRVERAGRIAICRRCRREILPGWKGSSLGRDAHRAAAAGMVQQPEPDPEALKIKARKERKVAAKNARMAAARARGLANPDRQIAAAAALQTLNLVVGAKIVLEIKGERLAAAPIDEECGDCQQLQSRVS